MGRGREGSGWEGRGGREGGKGGMNVTTYANRPQYLISSYVTYYVITCKSPFDWVYTEQWYVIISEQ